MATYEAQIENLIGEDINASGTDILQIDVSAVVSNKEERHHTIGCFRGRCIFRLCEGV